MQLEKQLSLFKEFRQNYTSQIYELDIKLLASSGLSWQTGVRLMKRLRGSIVTVADLVRQLQSMQETVVFTSGRYSLVSSALQAFYERISAKATFDLLEELQSSPPGTEPIMTRFLAWSLQRPFQDRVPKIIELLRRFMKIPYIDGSILHGSRRMFTWLERNQRQELHRQPRGSELIQSWTGQSMVLDQKLDESPLAGGESQLLITEFKLNSLTSFGWQVETKNKTILSHGYEASVEEAAEAAYGAWYQAHTTRLFLKAQQPVAGCKLVLLGNSISSEEYLKHPAKRWSILVQGEDRDPDLFVLNWPSLCREKRIFDIHHTGKNHIHLTTGTKLEMSDLGLHFYVYKPEQYISDEVVCAKCRKLGYNEAMNMRYVDGYGPTCGPCMERLVEDGQLSEGVFD